MGVCLAAALPVLPSPSWLVLLLLIAAALAWPVSVRAWAALPVGLLWFSGHAVWLEHREWPAGRADESVEVVGRIVGLPQQQGGRARIEVHADDASQRAGVPARILLSWYRPLEWFRPGESWRFRVRLEPPHGRLNPGLFDYHRYLIARHIGATGTIIAAERLSPGSLVSAPDRFRQRFADWLQAESTDLEVAALHRALTVGDRSAMSPELGERLRSTGTAHLLSISGLHVGMVAALAGLLAGALVTVFVALGLIRRGPDRKRTVLVAGLVGAFAYALLAGFSLPTQRALIMLLAGFGAMLWRRPIQPGYALLTALLAVLLFDPMAPLSVGFWLSFGAVAILIWAFAWRGQPSGWLPGLLRAQVVIAIGLLPLNIGIFHQWAPLALVANLVAIPLVGFWVLPALLLALVLFALGLPAEPVLGISESGLRLLLAGLDWLAGLSGRGPAAVVAEWSLPNRPVPGLAAVILAAFGAAWLLAPRGWPLRGMGAVLLLPLLWPPMDRLEAGEFDVLVADTGNGSAVIVTTRNETLLFDTGPGDGGMASLVPGTLAPLVRQSGAAGVDRIVVSHRNRDHAGGRAAAARVWPEAHIYSSFEPAHRRCRSDTGWNVDGIEFRFLHPSPTLPDLGGDSSCVLEVRSAAGSVLLTGGIGATVTRRLLLTGRANSIDAVMLPRSGHRDGFAPEWLDALAPRWALVSVAAFNRRGLPHAQIDARAAAVGAQVISTAECGALKVAFRQNRPARLETERARNPRFWHPAGDCPLR